MARQRKLQEQRMADQAPRPSAEDNLRRKLDEARRNYLDETESDEDYQGDEET